MSDRILSLLGILLFVAVGMLGVIIYEIVAQPHYVTIELRECQQMDGERPWAKLCGWIQARTHQYLKGVANNGEMVPSFTYISIHRASNGFVVHPIDSHGYEDEYICADIAEVQAAVETLLLQTRPKETWEE